MRSGLEFSCSKAQCSAISDKDVTINSRVRLSSGATARNMWPPTAPMEHDGILPRGHWPTEISATMKSVQPFRSFVVPREKTQGTYAPMLAFVFKCPRTDYVVRALVPEETGGMRAGLSFYKLIDCSVCKNSHLIDPDSGQALGEPERSFPSRRLASSRP